MPAKKKRQYKKRKPFRDARLFFIVAEGDREEKYFRYFDQMNARIHVQIIPKEAGKSAPKYFIDRAEDYLKQFQVRPGMNDQLWFVMDVDRWERSQIDEIIHACSEKVHWHVAISNPCFEVWVLYHFLDIIKDNGERCEQLKQQVHKLSYSGFNVEKVCPEIKSAMVNAEKADYFPDKDYPDRMVTKLYQLAGNMIEVLGENWK